MLELESISARSRREQLLRLRATFEAAHERSPALANLDAVILSDGVYWDLMELLRLGSLTQKELLLDCSTSAPELLTEIMSTPRS